MNISQSAKQIITPLLVFLLALAPFEGRANALSIAAVADARQNEADEDGVTFDNLLAESSYTIYVEARDIGQQLRSVALNELIEPLAPMSGRLPKELDTLARFAVTNADTLSRSRLMIAFEPAKPSLPYILMALELASADAAQEFQGKLQELLASMLSPAARAKNDSGNGAASSNQQPPMPSPFVIKRAGRVLAFSTTPFTFKGLRGGNDKPISDDANFRAAHDRFYSETIFFYIDLALSARVAKERQEAMQKRMEDSGDGLRKDAEAEGRLDEFERPEAQRNSSGRTPPPEMASPATPLAVNERPAPAPVEESPAPAPKPESASQTAPDKKLAGAKAAPPSTSAAAAVNAASTSSKPAPPAQGRGRRAGESLEISVDPTLAPPPPPPPAAPQESRGGGSDHLMGLLDMIITRSLRNTSTPDAAALALTLENDSLILRALVVTGQGTAFGPIPFIPILVSGPAQASGAASYMPADTDIFITASLDLPRLYDTALGMFGMLEDSSSSRAQKSKEPSLESKVAAFEKANGFKIRDEIAATLGSEIAVGIPARYLNATPIARVPLSPQSSQSGLLFLVSVRDKEALRSKLRPVLEAVGLKSPNEKGLTEKRGDIEINSYSGVSMAFIDSYLVIGSDAAAIRRVLDARAKNETLATSRDFHSYMQWQPRETLAQAYVSGTILKDLFRNPSTLDSRYDEEGRRFLARFNFEPEPITYLAASDVLGPLYELRVPKNLLKRVFAEMAVDELRMGVVRNESAAKNILGMLSEMEKSYKTEHGRYATLEELEGFEQFKEYLQSGGYKIDLSVSGNRYEATMTPTEYGKTGRLSFYLDQSGVVREGDHGGGRATAADKKSDSDN